MIEQAHIEKSISYEDYLKLLQDLLAEGKTTGNTQSAEYVAYAKINLQRMARLRKTVVLEPELKTVLKDIKNEYIIIILTEGWCGDASQNIPVFVAVEEFQQLIKVCFLLRDENPELMNQYLTNGSKSIPKAICVEKQTLEEKFVWGPRPKDLQQEVEALLKAKVSKEEKGLFVQNWYNQDHTLQIQKELRQLFKIL